MDVIKKGWFSEVYPDAAFSIKVNKVLFHERSEYQDIQVLESDGYDNVLVLDGRVQATESDEFPYQEMAALLPLNSHPNPERVLVVGGGDGGIAFYAADHPSVKEVVLCDKDQMVIDASKKYLGSTFDSPKLKIHIGDGSEYLKERKGYFDVIITDSSDPHAREESDESGNKFYHEDYFRLLNQALRENGIACSQGETFWGKRKLMVKQKRICKKIFPVVEFATVAVCSYIGGQLNLLLMAKSSSIDFSEPATVWTNIECDQKGLHYYSTDVHKASFVLPRFVAKIE